MRVDLVITELNVGGAERCLTELAIASQNVGKQVRVASIGSLPTGSEAVLVDRLNDAGIEVFSTRCDQARQAPTAYSRLRQWFSENPPDLVQSMLYHANVVGTAAARAAGVQACIGAIRVAEHRAVRLWIEKHAVRRMDALVCVSQSVRRFAEREFGRSLPSTVVIPNGIDVPAIDEAEGASWSRWGWPDDAEVLLYVGRLHPQKGIDVLSEALPQLFETHPSMRCMIVGDGPSRSAIQAVADRVGPQRMKLTGRLDDVIPVIKASRLVVLPSRYEGMPNVVLEAMAAGRPVAACRVEGVEELLGSAAALQTCEPENAAALSRLVDELWTHRDRKAIGEQNRERAVHHYRLPEMVRAYHQLYRSIV